MPERSFPATGALAPRVPVARPELPLAEDIARYMTMLDGSRVYTNLGSMSLTLEARLKTHFGLTTGGATATASGWAAITGAIRAGPDVPGRTGRSHFVPPTRSWPVSRQCRLAATSPIWSMSMPKAGPWIRRSCAAIRNCHMPGWCC